MNIFSFDIIIDGFNNEIDLSDDCPVNCNGVVYWTDVTLGAFSNKDFMIRIERNLCSTNFLCFMIHVLCNAIYARDLL